MKTQPWLRKAVVLVLLSAALPSVRAGSTVGSDRSIGPGDTSLDGQDIVVDHATLTLGGSHTFASLQLVNGAVLTHDLANTGQSDRAIRLAISGNASLDASSRFDVSGKGYRDLGTPGAGAHGDWSGGGGGHGGNGNQGGGNPPGQGGRAFGSLLAPDSWGGSGGEGDGDTRNAGGGLIHIEVGGTLTIEGAVRSDGSPGQVNNSGGGAGGTVFLKASTLSGSGSISANGAGGEWVDGGGGGGGRIALFYSNNQFGGRLSAVGGGGASIGGAGTIYLKPASGLGEIRVGNSGWGEWTPIVTPASYDLSIRDYGVVNSSETISVRHLTVGTNGVLTHATGSTGLVVNVTGNVLIENQGAISADARGYSAATEPGPGVGVHFGWGGSGGGHGGLGGYSGSGGIGGVEYGSMLQPVMMGSQGGDSDVGQGTAGGGAIRLVVAGSLTVNGRLSADAAGSPPDNAGGGAGGSIWVTAGSVGGTGVISANGGPGEWVDGGGGSGGRIALYYGNNAFSGTLTAIGGGGHMKGGAGTVYTKGASEAQGSLVVDNGGAMGNYTPLTSPEAFRLQISGSAYCYPEGALALARLDVLDNSILTQLTGQSNINLHILGDARVDTNAQITTDGRGYPIGNEAGPGTGTQVTCCGAGGSHAGLGGQTAAGAVPGPSYDSIAEPVALGSQGGSGEGGPGAAGGGAIRIMVDGKLTVEGRLSADGTGAIPNNAGGGAGGSIWLTVGSLAGTGTISANGGAGEWVDGGGGGGGRLALYYGANDFVGAMKTYGGGGSQRGGAGTIYTRKNGTSIGQLLIHNGGIWGNYTPVSSPEPFQLTIAEQAAVYPETALTLQDLDVRTNSLLTHLTGQARCEVTVLNNATVWAGGSIGADGRGYPVGGDPGPGTGARIDCCGAGAGHGATGGASTSGAQGGSVYGSMVQPLTAGSAGASGDGGPGGAGGGVIFLKVGKTLGIDGQVSANGSTGVLDNSGGGAGGSVYITAGKLSGAGTISVNGGAGEWVDGGGGAGGRIALHIMQQGFTGQLLAQGGGGHQRGGAGTIYTQLAGEAGGELVLENGGNPGALTPLQVPPSTRLVLSGGTAVYPTESLAVASLTLKPGALLTQITGQTGLTVQVAGDLIVQSGATISVDGKGYPVNGDSGPGAGGLLSCCGSGGGHGGEGGSSTSGQPGGLAYDSIIEPVARGSQGGASDSGVGGAGGGAIRLVVGGACDVSGSVSANGSDAPVNNSGGGSAGSIWITAAKLTGAGSITANGGAGEWVDGGGGGGGRIALHVDTNEFAGTLTAHGRGGHQTGGAGTVYTRLSGDSVGQLLVENGGAWGAYTPLEAAEPFHLTLANCAQGYAENPLVVGSLILQTNSVLTHLKGQSGFNAVVLGDALLDGAVNVDGRGYPVGSDSGPGVGQRADWAGSGAGHGGIGGTSATGMPGGAAYGSQLEPTTLGSQGGPGDGGVGGDGGGAVRMVVGGTLTLDGSITANGLNAPFNNAGGGSGGSVFLSARSLAGAGTIQANGGAGEWVDGGGGAGGRVSIYRTTSSFTGAIMVKGAGGSHTGQDGTIQEASAPMIVWLSPPEGWVSGTLEVEIAVFANGTPATAQFDLMDNNVATPLANVAAGMTASTTWDSTTAPDGVHTLQVTVRDGNGAALAQSTRQLAVNNSVVWHRGNILTDQTWTAGRVHVVQGELTIGDNVSLTLQPGCVVKFLPGGGLTLGAGATLNGLGTSAAPTVLTSFSDDTFGGDSNLDGDASHPTPGTWRLALKVGSTLNANAFTHLRFNSQSYGGTLAASATWTSDTLHQITDTVIVPGGMTLTLEAGAIVKFERGQGINVQKGGALITKGSLVQPVVFTSVQDDAFGGDTNEDGTRTAPAAGDWRSLRFEDGSSGTLDHAEIRFGGDSVGNPWGAGGVIEALGGPLTVRNSVIADALKDGGFCYGTTRFENCVVLRCDRGLTAVGTMEVINCTLDNNRIGLLEHVGQLNVHNSIICHSINVGVSHDLGGGTPVVTCCNVWNPGATQGNYSGTDDRTGKNGNISAEPRFKNYDADNFRLNYASPGIDAADGTVAPSTDFAGSARYDDPRTGNTGVPGPSGAVPDMGAFEFVESAPSNIDLVVGEVSGPVQLMAGSLAHVSWTIVNRGSEPVSGPWHDAVYLRSNSTGQRLGLGEVLVGKGLIFGPGQSCQMEADVQVPGGVTGAYNWLIAANSRGELFEGANAANNETAAESSASLNVPLIVLDGAPVTDSFSAQEDQRWFQCVAPAGKDVGFNLDLLAATGISELYVGRGFVPTPDNFTARQREWSAPDTSAIGSGTGDPTGPGQSNVFYVLAIGQVLPAVPQSFTLRASSAAFSVDSVAPATAGNASLVTLDLRGSGFTAATSFTLRHGADQRIGQRQSVRESGRAFVTFDLSNFPIGKADVLATLGGLNVTLPSAVDIVAGGAPDFYTVLSGPTTSRAGRLTTWFVTYGNRGLVDVTLPLLRFNAPGAQEIQLFDSTLNWADSVVFLALNPDVFLPTLGPGQEVTVELRVKTLQPITAQLQMITGDELLNSGIPFDWNSLTAPAGADPAHWTALLDGLKTRLGATLADYAALLTQDLDALRASDLRYSYIANVNGRWLFGDEPEGVPTERPILDVPPNAPDVNTPLSRPQTLSVNVKPAGDGIHKTWWVVITDEDYTGIHANTLPGTRKDWDDVMNYLKLDLRVPAEQITGGHDGPGDGAWKRQFVLDELKKFKGKVDADDNLVIVFSGHGGRIDNGTGYLCFNYGYMSPVAFTQAIDEVGAGTTYFINDSCHSEAFNDQVNPSHTTFVGFAATMANRISHDTASGGELVKNLKGQLRKCHSLGLSFDLTEQMVAKKYESNPEVKKQQHPVLSNPANASLEGKPWNDPSGFEQELKRAMSKLTWHLLEQQILSLVGSVDPNGKDALSGTGAEHWIQPNQALAFEILFENKPTAAAPAQEVLVTDDLDPDLDWSTLELESIAFNNVRLAVPPGLQRFTTTTDVPTDPNEVVVDIDLNQVTGRVTWHLWSRDAVTGDLPEDPFAGFLPPNDSTHRGEGLLSYTIRTKPGVPDGTTITNSATIIFDPTYGANPPIVTPTVTNTVDSTAPTSQVQSLAPGVSGDFPVSWTGSGGPIASFDVYVSRNNGPFELWQIATTNLSATFAAQPGSTYAFFSIARDPAGNTEAAPAAPDASTHVAGGVTYATWASTQALPANASGPGDDPDGDGLTNFAEYAFGLNPMVADRQLSAPKAALADFLGQRYLTLTFRRPKVEPSDVLYHVTTSNALVPWANQGTAVPVGDPVDRGTYVEITVRAPQPITGSNQGFLQLQVQQ